MRDFVEKLGKREFYNVFRIQSCAIRSITDFMYKNDVVWLTPVILSPETDPLCHPVFDASIEYYGQRLHLTKSMILHKQIALISENLNKIYIMSPNVRLETEDLNNSGKHLIEFSQVDIEFKDKTKKDFMRFTEDLVVKVFGDIRKDCGEDLESLARTLRIPKKPFRVYESKKLREEHGNDFEQIVSEKSIDPFWIMDYEREFYDREETEEKGYYHNYDLVWPEGFGEALSGGEREFEYKVILRKMEERKMNPDDFKNFLELAGLGKLPKTVGGGLGIERLIRFITGIKDIKDVTLFPRIPGEKIVI